MIAIAGLTLGAPLAPDAIAIATKRLESADRFEAVDIRKRYRSIEHAEEVVLVILVDERPHPMDVPTPPVLKPFRTLRDGLMFLPLVSYTDGYGLSYGAQFSFANVLGKRSRIGVPLTWGAERRAAVELERKFQRGPVSRVEGGAGVVRREHPFFEVPDRRGELWARAEPALPLALRVGGGVRWSDIAFADAATPALEADDWLLASGLDVALDTRIDPTFPRNAVYARAAWEHLDFDTRPSRNRTTLDGRGFLGLFGSSVLALRATHGRADGPLPPYEQWLLGGPVVGPWLQHGQRRRRPHRLGIDSSCGSRSRRHCGWPRRASPSSSIAGRCGTMGSGWPTPTGSRVTAPACSPSRRCSSSVSTSPTARAAAPAPTSAPACRSEPPSGRPLLRRCAGACWRCRRRVGPHRVDVEHVAVRGRRGEQTPDRNEPQRQRENAADERGSILQVEDASHSIPPAAAAVSDPK